jgi:D-glycerate 3-kinase
MSSLQTQQRCSELIEQLQLPDSFQEIVTDIYLPLSQIILQQKKDQPLLISINGAQGTGKSTMARFIKHIIESEMDCQVADLSLDDFYSVREKRMSLAKDVHPLFATRGVPGTHDVDLIEQVFDSLLNRRACRIPRFNKAIDDRDAESAWTDCNEPVEVILFEGWCNNSPAQSAQELERPVKELEEKEDPHGIWRQYVNKQLIDYRQRLFDHADMSIMLKAPDFERIYEWRSLQEQKLAASSAHLEQNQVMNESELMRFIQHYERISRHTLEHLPAMADVVLPVAADHSITGIVQKDV